MKEDSYKDAIFLLNLQKHDLLNDLQLILSNVQLNNLPEAEKFVKKAVEVLKHKGTILKIVYPKLAISLLLQMKKAFDMNVPLTVECKSDLEYTHVDEDLLTSLLEKVWDEILTSRLKFPPEEQVVNFILDSDDSFVFIGDDIKTHIEAATIDELSILFAKIDYELICTDEVLRIAKV